MCYRKRLLFNKFNAKGSGNELECRFTKFGEITQSKGHYAIQGHRFCTNRKLIVIYDFL